MFLALFNFQQKEIGASETNQFDTHEIYNQIPSAMKQSSVYKLLLFISLLLNLSLLVIVIWLALTPNLRTVHSVTNVPVCSADILQNTQPGSKDTNDIRKDGSSHLAQDRVSERTTGSSKKKDGGRNRAKSTRKDENIFMDLTEEEIRQVLQYMYSLKDPTLVVPEVANVTDSQILLVELYLPKKAEALAFLSGQGPKPMRQARVITFEPRATPPRVMEYVVTPLPHPVEHFPDPRRVRQVSYI